MDEQRVEMLEKKIEELERVIARLTTFIVMDGDALTIRATGDVAIAGLNVRMEGASRVSVKAGAVAELSASGQTSVRGAMVMIN